MNLTRVTIPVTDRLIYIYSHTGGRRRAFGMFFIFYLTIIFAWQSKRFTSHFVFVRTICDSCTIIIICARQFTRKLQTDNIGTRILSDENFLYNIRNRKLARQ